MFGLSPASSTLCEKGSPQQMQIRETTRMYYQHKIPRFQTLIIRKLFTGHVEIAGPAPRGHSCQWPLEFIVGC